LKTKDDKALLMNFVNSWLAEPWREDVGKTQTSEISRLSLDREPNKVPAKALVLTAGIDVQQDHFVAVIRAWGYLQESWLIRAQRLESWEDVISVLFKTRFDSEDGRELMVRLACFDSGYRSDEVYEVCRAWSGVAVPTKGRDHLGGEAYRAKKIETFASGKPIPGGLLLFHLDTTYFKDKIFRLIRGTSEGTPGGWHLHKTPSDDYLNQICAESKVMVVDKRTRKKTWEWRLISSHAPNHFLDAEVGAAAAAEILRVYDLKPEGPAVVQQAAEGSKETWIPRMNNWIRR
jgi:phage terminase large subunit GpA-like protein